MLWIICSVVRSPFSDTQGWDSKIGRNLANYDHLKAFFLQLLVRNFGEVGTTYTGSNPLNLAVASSRTNTIHCTVQSHSTR